MERIHSDPESKVFLDWLMEETGVLKPRFSRDPNKITWNEARRHLGTSILHLLAKDNLDAQIEQINQQNQQNNE